MSGRSIAVEPCSECDKVRLEQSLGAEEAARASTRDVAKVDRGHEHALEQLERGKQLDTEEADRALTRDVTKLEREHEQALDTAEDAAVTAIQQARLQADAELGKLFHESLSGVATGSIERSRDSAKYVQTAAAAIAALYTGSLGLVFSVTSHPLPVRGIAAAVFLALSVALATAYLAYISRAAAPPMYAGGSSLSELQINRTAYLTDWVNAIINQRRWALRASVLSLAFGVAFIPAAFVASRRPASIPAAPTAPAIPVQIAPEVATTAAMSFKAQVASYDSAVTARNSAIASAATASKTAGRDERRANWVTLGLALLGILVVLLGPLIKTSH
jgi:hypothetical protein